MAIDATQNHLLPVVFPARVNLRLAEDTDSQALTTKRPTPPATPPLKVIPRRPVSPWEKGVLVDYYT